MESLEFRPKYSFSFWWWPAVWMILLLSSTLSANRTFLADPPTLLDGLAGVALYAVVLCFSFLGQVRKITIGDQIIIDRYLAPAVTRDFQDFVGIADGVIHLQGFSIDAGQFRNGEKLIRRFAKLVEEGRLTPREIAGDCGADGPVWRVLRVIPWIGYGALVVLFIVNFFWSFHIISPNVDLLLLVAALYCVCWLIIWRRGKA